MPHPGDIAERALRTPAVAELLSMLSRRRLARVHPVWQSAAALILAAARREAQGDILAITSTIDEGDEMAEDLELFVPGSVLHFPASEELPGEESESVAPGRARQLQILTLLRDRPAGNIGRVIVAPVQAVLQPMLAPAELERATLPLRIGGAASQDETVAWLESNGFKRVGIVAAQGEFGVRGGIVDVFSPASDFPARVEFFGDRIESLREFDAIQQTSRRMLSEYRIVAPVAPERKPQKASILLDYLPDETICALCEPEDLESNVGAILLGIEDSSAPDWEQLSNAVARFRRLLLYRNPPPDGTEDALHIPIAYADSFGPDQDSAMKQLERICEESRRVTVFCNNDAEKARFEKVAAGYASMPKDKLSVEVGRLNHGFRLVETGCAFIPNHRIFRRYKQRREPKQPTPARGLDAFFELENGDYVVHAAHGIARFLGVKRMEDRVTGERREYLVLEFANSARLHVPTTKIEVVQKYLAGGRHAKPELSRIGSRAWESRKLKVQEACEDLASRLLSIQASREVVPGFAYPPDSQWQQEFEAEFIYEETGDQLDTIACVKADLESPRPMDRLICGDVGFGKTEIAIRAAFKTVLSGKQVAVLVPTTVLAQQHFITFQERTADYPVNIEVLSRFRTPGEAKTVIEQLRAGKIDVLIGTHRIIQKDVVFRDLGLVIIDEEQRFGVDHKERLKRLKPNVDVLTLTATPIPRTMHMTLLGLRDVSSLTTPPQDRLAIETRLMRFNLEAIRHAILREMARQGQVFFVHNRIHNIEHVAAQIKQAVPEARIAIGHGRMGERELAQTMRAFIDKQYDILVCTTIIESGLDIPNANTIFINQADRFGLAELHQLRGRVGRYKHRAYCYLVVPDRRPVTPEAEERLKAIREFAELGAGFQIALRDLEIRGAGNLLGAEQSGHIAAVGYDMYCRLLEIAVAKAKGAEVQQQQAEVDINIGLDCAVPEDYIPDVQSRLRLYRRLHRTSDPEEVEHIVEEMIDRFGKPPLEVLALAGEAKLRILSQRNGIRSILRKDRMAILEIGSWDKLADLKSRSPAPVRIIDDKTVHVHYPNPKAGPFDALEFLLKLLR
ncbi:MAG TPA: transcription-repair coupling factor [Candidatus Brocadiia bacterium]|nr:transcription-repair coupling factor [Candidatus Brocadiia bacterium]